MGKFALLFVLLAAMCGNFGESFAADTQVAEIIDVNQAGVVVTGPIPTNAFTAVADFSLSAESGDSIYVEHLGIMGTCQYGAFNFSQVQLYELGNDGSMMYVAQGEISNSQNSTVVIFRNFEFDGGATYVMYGSIGDTKGGPPDGLVSFSLTDFSAYDLYDGVTATASSYGLIEQMYVRPQVIVPTVQAELDEPGIVRSSSTGAIVHVTLQNALNPSDIRFTLIGQNGAYGAGYASAQGADQYEQVRIGSEVPAGSYQVLVQVLVNGVYWSAVTDNLQVVPPLQILGSNPSQAIVGGNLYLYGDSFNSDYPMEVSITGIDDPTLHAFFETEEVWNNVNGGSAIVQVPAYMIRYSGKGSSVPERVKTPLGRYSIQLSGFAGYDSVAVDVIDPSVLMETKLGGQTIVKGTKLKVALDVTGYDYAELVLVLNTGLTRDTRSLFVMNYSDYGTGHYADQEIDTALLPCTGNWEIQIRGVSNGYLGSVDTTGTFALVLPPPVPPVVVVTEPSEPSLTVTYAKGPDGLWKPQYDKLLFKESGLTATDSPQRNERSPLVFKATPISPKSKK